MHARWDGMYFKRNSVKNPARMSHDWHILSGGFEVAQSGLHHRLV